MYRNYPLALISTSKKIKDYFNSQKGEKVWNRKRSIKKNHRNCLLPGLGVWSRQKPVWRLHTCTCNLPLKLNVLNRLPPWSSLGEQFLRISKNDLSWFHRIFLLFDTNKPFFLQMFLLRSIKACLRPNTWMINFDAVDFSECRPEEVISFFRCSVYTALMFYMCKWVSLNLYKVIYF